MARGRFAELRAATSSNAGDAMAVDPCRRALRDLDLVRDFLDQIRNLIDEAPGDDPHLLLHRIRSLADFDRPIRVLIGRLLRDLVGTHGLYRLGYLRVRDFAEERLHVSERTARSLVREIEMFADCPALEAAWTSGRIGIRQAILIHRVAPLALVPALTSARRRSPPGSSCGRCG